MKKLVLVLLIVLLAGGGVFAQAKIKIGVSMPAAAAGFMGGATWWAKKAIADWTKKDPSLEFYFVAAETVAKQAGDLEDLVVKGVKSVCIFPYDASLTSVIEKIYEKGIYTVVLDRGTTKPCYDVWLRNDDEGYATQGMEQVCKLLGYKGNVVLIEGVPCPITTIRTDMSKAVAAKYPGIKILDFQPAYWNRQKALEVMENYLQKYRQIDAIYTADDDMLMGALQAYKESGRKDLKVAVGGACMKELVKKIMDDSDPLVKADVTYPPDVLATGVSLAVLGVKGRTFEGFYQKKLPVRIILASELVTKENAKDYYHPDSPF
jgi:ribose transport system substrate-binding protein